MSFANILDHVVTSGHTRQNILTDGQFTCTYGEVPALLEHIEQFLAQHGIGSGICLAVECINSLPSALLLLALLRKGTSFVLTPPAAGTSDLKPTPHFCAYRLTVAAATVGDAAPSFPVSFLRLEPHPGYNGRPAAPEKLYLRTSGSMGASKIVVHTHEKLLGNARNCVEKYGFAPESRAVIPVPLAHMYGFGAEFLPAIMAGACIDLLDRMNLLKYLDRERHFQPTIVFATPAICDMLLKGYKTPRTTYAVFVTSGQRISEELFRTFDPWVGGRLINQYGSTEMGATAACDPDDSLEHRATAIGRPMSGVQLRVDALSEDANTAPGVGELYCQHPYGFEGYMDENGEWLHQAAPESWYRTGDLATVQPDGAIIVVGRADASVNRSGYLVLLSDIERIMEKLAAIGEVAVVAGQGESKQGQRIAAFCVPRSGILLDGAQLRQLCFDVLPQYAIPDEVRMLEALPLLPSGKVDRQALAALVP